MQLKQLSVTVLTKGLAQNALKKNETMVGVQKHFKSGIPGKVGVLCAIFSCRLSNCLYSAVCKDAAEQKGELWLHPFTIMPDCDTH